MPRGPWICVAAAVAAAWVGWIFVSRHMSSVRWENLHRKPDSTRNAEFERLYGGGDLRILQFYAREGVITEGGKTVICYGVVNARSVRVSPPLEGVGVSLNRCIDAAPLHDTRYMLTAEGDGGRTASASLEIRVEPDSAELPKISYFRVAEKKKDYLGRAIYLLEYADQNGEEITIEPPGHPVLRHAPMGRTYVRPETTTTYTLVVKGKNGHVARQALTLAP